jgi:hypothetical protein
MTEQTEAQRLANALEETPDSDGHCRQAAAELRRLEWDNKELRRCAEVQEVEKYAAANRRLEAVNAQLLEALLDLQAAIESRGVIPTVKALSKTDAAIKAAKGGA